MIAVYINPLVCQSAYWFLFPECWGIAVYVAVVLALIAAGAVKRFAWLRCRLLGHAFGAPQWIGRCGFVQCAECGCISDGMVLPRTVLKRSVS